MQLHFCPTCAREDAMKYGVPYWHCKHQIPGVYACSCHHCQLLSRPALRSPHIAVEFYPNEFYSTPRSENQENDFAEFAGKILTRLADGEDISCPPLSYDTPATTYMSNMHHNVNARLSVSLSDLLSHLWGGNSAPFISDKTRFVHYILSHYDNIFPVQKLLLVFYLERMQNFRQGLICETGLNETESTYERQRFVMETNEMMLRLWSSTKCIAEFRSMT